MENKEIKIEVKEVPVQQDYVAEVLALTTCLKKVIEIANNFTYGLEAQNLQKIRQVTEPFKDLA